MTIDEFKTYGHKIVDWIAEFYETIEERPVMSQVMPGEVKTRLPSAAPETPESMDRILADFDSIILPGITHWQHPSFFAYFPANGSFPSLLAEMLTAALGAQCMIWQTSPAAAELEEVVMEWLKKGLGLPDAFTGVLQDTASTATLCALVSAREKATGFAGNEKGAAAAGKAAGTLRVYTSAESHSSVEKGAKIAGFGRENVIKIPVDGNFAMIPDKLEEILKRDLAAGYKPACIVAALGSTSSLALDPLGPVGRIAERFGLWFHVDAAMAGSAALLPEKRRILEGVEYADSFVFNPHKWLFTNFDCSAYFVKDPAHLINTFSITPEYLKTSVDGEVKNYRDWGVQLGRRFRALKLWFVLRSFGLEGLREKLRAHIAQAEQFTAWLREDGRFEILAPVNLNLVCFRYIPRSGQSPRTPDSPGVPSEAELETINKKLLDRVNGTGKVFLTHTKLNGKFTLRMCIGQTNTEERHVRQAWELLRDYAGS
ncbi:MAG: aspartate aminotransferase family protein [Spirochaetales bacterium]|nr:MAG: aspartate aminotransferase family protein [Spirochaetales bacterium]